MADNTAQTPFDTMLDAIRRALGHTLADGAAAPVLQTGAGNLPSVFPVTDLAAASVAAAGLAVADLLRTASRQQPAAAPAVTVDRRLASFWFATSLRPEGWETAPTWDAVAGDYRTADGWIRLHTNAPHHRRAALAVLGVAVDKARVAEAVARWQADALETAIVAAGGCAARMRSVADWAAHEHGRSLANEPLLWTRTTEDHARTPLEIDPARPLRGVKVLDLTRVLAGPVATRFLAGFGAQVLRIDPPDWSEPPIEPEVLLGKATARLDLRQQSARERLISLLRQADVLVHGYRPGALDGLGLDAAARRRIRPGLVDISLDAYGWTGPWKTRRGFDSLMQMSAGIAEAGMRVLGRDRPTPLPVQALDHATGYMLAAAALTGLAHRVAQGGGFEARASLGRTALLLTAFAPAPLGTALAPEGPADLCEAIEQTGWGPARRLLPPVQVAGAPMLWERPARPIGSDPAEWVR